MRPRHHLLIAGLTLLFVFLGMSVSRAGASAPAPGNANLHFSSPAAGGNDACLACHQNQQLSVTLGAKRQMSFRYMSIRPRTTILCMASWGSPVSNAMLTSNQPWGTG